MVFRPLALIYALALVESAAAQTGVDSKAAHHIAELYACSQCHHPTLKVLWPSFKDIAARCQNDSDGRLISKGTQWRRRGLRANRPATGDEYQG